jgi:hypothetical protein
VVILWHDLPSAPSNAIRDAKVPTGNSLRGRRLRPRDGKRSTREKLGDRRR